MGAATIPAAGTVPWRLRDGRLEVALVHRPRYDDWSWPKGKLDPGEEWPVTAARETHEEAGLVVRLGRPLPDSAYTVLTRAGEAADKVVRYWAAEVVGGHGRTLNEVDEVAWLVVHAAHGRLDYARDRDQLRAVVQAHQEGDLATWPLLVVRHAKAIPRGRWSGDDWLRELDAAGHERARALVPLLAAYGVERLVSSSSTRCVQTLEPYAASAGLRIRTKRGLSEEGHDEDPTKAAKHMAKALAKGRPVALSGHGPVLPAMVQALAEQAAPEPRSTLAVVGSDGMDKGEALVCHLVGTGADAQIVAVERHRL